VAIIGATRKTGPGSFNLIENMRSFGFQGKIYPVNPQATEISGLKAYRDVGEIPGRIDLAVISTPREQVPPVVETCADLGIQGAIIVPQGFADADEKGKALQEALTRIARTRGIRILGPNTLGIHNAFSGFTSSFMPLTREKVPVGVICQSGIFFVGAPLFTGMMGKGIDVANSCDLDFADALEYFGQDDDIRVIFAHIEGMKDGKRFFEAAQSVARQKTVIALKTARSAHGARAAASHSGSLVGDHQVFEAVFRQTGILSAQDPEEGIDYTKAFLTLPLMRGNRIGVITFTGAGGIILVDAFERFGLQLAQLGDPALRRIKDLSPPWMPIQNPMDIWPALMKHGLNKVYEAALTEVLKDPGVDGVICIAIAPFLPDQAYLDATEVISHTAAQFPDKPVAVWLYGPNQAAMIEKIEREGTVISLPTIPRTARTLARLLERHRFLAGKPTPPPALSIPAAKVGKGLIRGFSERGVQKMDGEEARALLAAYGIPAAQTRFCRNTEEALEAGEMIGYPVVCKVSSPQITHKTDLGGVKLDLRGPAELKAAIQNLSEEIALGAPEAEIEGFLIQEMAKGGVEVFLGAKRDPLFGAVVLFGQGGIYTEVWKDLSYAVAPFSVEDARRMIRETRIGKILEGVRGEKPYDREGLADALLRLAQLMEDHEAIREIDLNPFMVFHEGGLAVDFRIIF
jgi:acetyltransferase